MNIFQQVLTNSTAPNYTRIDELRIQLNDVYAIVTLLRRVPTVEIDPSEQEDRMRFIVELNGLVSILQHSFESNLTSAFNGNVERHYQLLNDIERFKLSIYCRNSTLKHLGVIVTTPTLVDVNERTPAQWCEIFGTDIPHASKS